MGIRENFLEVKQSIEEILIKQGRSKDDVTLVAVTKLHEIDEIMEAIAAGATDIGENKVQELIKKLEYLPDSIQKHFQGTLQTNKVKDIIGKVSLIHSMDRISLLKELEKRGKKENIVSNVLIQMNISGEETKHGWDELELEKILDAVEQCNYVKVLGLMTMAPHADNPDDIRWVFRNMKALFDRLKERSFKNVEMKYLSMGMSNDYLVAVEEGSNMVRVGTKIFGQRDYSKNKEDLRMAFFDKLKSAIGLEEDYEDEWDDEEYEDEKEIYEEESVVPVEETYTSTRRRELGSMMNLQQGAYGKMQIAIHEPMTYEDGPKVLNDVKAKKIVLLNFEMLETEKKKQVFEFVNGGIYSLEAQIQKVTKDLFVIAPKGIFIEGKASMDRFADPGTFNFSQQ